MRDRFPGNPDVASIAAVGFGLASLVVGAERGWQPYRDIRRRVDGTLDTFLRDVERTNGFCYHFLDMKTAKRCWDSEVSVIDTAILLCGAIVAGEYFGGRTSQKAEELFEAVDWRWYTDEEKCLFHMGYLPESGFFGEWDEYAEQFMMYFLGAASPTFAIDPGMFYAYTRNVDSYEGIGPVVHSTTGSLFVYQFSHAFFDLRGKSDRWGVDWWRNSVNATLANRQYCINHANVFRGFGPESWGLTACDGPYGYSGAYGAPPRKVALHHGNDGTIPPCGPAGSMVFTPDLSIAALTSMHKSIPELWGRYGFRDAYNLDVTPHWFASDYVGIDKGISLLMIENHRTGLIWEVFNGNRHVLKGMESCGVS